MQHACKHVAAPSSPPEEPQEQQQRGNSSDTAVTTPSPTTPVRQPSPDHDGSRSPGVDMQKLQELEQRVSAMHGNQLVNTVLAAL